MQLVHHISSDISELLVGKGYWMHLILQQWYSCFLSVFSFFKGEKKYLSHCHCNLMIRSWGFRWLNNFRMLCLGPCTNLF